ncbi:hypothetical protein Arth_0696 [Arthrobacter sp. FB24]|uniref:hypothetical protein n=1 Tax=Arthrobacter sp. (strain FB24) TaxID=290399 RepID=UPI0000526C4C|nr:hypothetical protein [Arthrobacter sp. FB24]ABK02095.1 hypothetical protein Arth_0696 [Arthrobacter sp. FB24]
MKRREVWGSSLIVTAALCTWADLAISEAYGAAARKDLFLYVGIPADSVASWFLIVALLSGAVGLSLLLPAMTGRITKKGTTAHHRLDHSDRGRGCRASA